ncbi:glycosyltransferase family 4 protein [Rhodospirillaceae bacterium SYSU D60014]|uniref:glycosyltransferase family 4 protein n=1 Tax=Virgifigura deserti TaxID=2268457 RepID=UPI000E66C19F
MKILSVCYEYPPVGGGGATVCQGTAEAFVKAGHEVDVVTSGMKDLPPFEERNGVGIHRVRCIRLHRHYSTAPELLTQILPSYRKALELMERKAYDVNHCHFVVPSGLVSYLLWKRRRLPYILTAHGSDVPGYNPDRFDLMHRLIKPVWRRVIAGSSGVTTPSHFLAELIQRQIDVPVEVIPNPYDPPKTADVSRRNRILVATRMVERKGVQDLIRAFAQLKTDWELVVAGDGPSLPMLKALAAETGARATFLGFIPRQDLAALYRTAKIFVFPSLQENFPMVLLEAMAAGCAVVTSTAPGCAEVVGDAGIKVEPRNVEALRTTLERLVGDETEIKTLGRLGQDRIDRFASARVTVQYEATFLRCTGVSKAADRQSPAARGAG